MKRATRCITVLAVAAVAALSTGCAGNTDFVYKPTPPAAGDRKLPVKVAVLPFTDGTENFTRRGSPFSEDNRYNLAKTGVPKTMNALPPEVWGKFFADELAASGSFRSVRFVYASSEFPDADFSIDGTLKKVVFGAAHSTFEMENELLVSFRAVRNADKRLVWEKEVERVWRTPKDLFDGCLSAKCGSDRMSDHWNKRMGSLLAEARADLLETLASPEGGTGEAAGAGAAAPRAGESVERTIDRILNNK